MKKRIKEKVQRIFLIINLIAMNMAFGVTVHAENKLLNSKLVQGTIALINDGVLVLLAIEGVAIGALEAWQFFKYQWGTDEEKAKAIKNAKGIGIVGAVIVCLTGGGGLVSLILSYYTGTSA